VELLANSISWIKENYSLLISVESILLLLVLIMILSIYLKSKHEFFIEMIWIYSAFVPAFTILFLNYNPSIKLIFCYLLLQLIFAILYIRGIVKNYKKVVEKTKSPLKKIKTVTNPNYGKEKSLEYVGLFMLPFITVNDSINILTVVVIILIVVLIIKRFELFYLNLPILLFFKIQFVETNHRVKMIVLTPKNFEFEIENEYDIRTFIKKLNLYIFIPKDF
jgi:hypothetical protein